MRRQLMKLHRLLLEQGRYAVGSRVFRLLHRGWIQTTDESEEARVFAAVGFEPACRPGRWLTYRIPGGII